MTVEFDRELRDRVLAFQEHHGLVIDGWAGGETWGKLVEIGYGAVSTSSADTSLAGMATAAVSKPAKHPDAPDVLTVETLPITAEKPAPAEGKPRNTTDGDRVRLDDKRKQWNPEQPKERFHVDHVDPHSQNAPGNRQRIRNKDAHNNMSEGTQIRRENRGRRQQPDWQDPKSPNYTRPVEKKKPKGSGKPGAQTSAKPAGTAPGQPATKAPGTTGGTGTKPPTTAGTATPSKPSNTTPSQPAAKAPGGTGVTPSTTTGTTTPPKSTTTTPNQPTTAGPGATGGKPPAGSGVKAPGEPTVKPAGEPAVKPSAGSGLKGAGSKLFSAAGEAQMAYALAKDLEWRDSLRDPKWGKTHVDAAGQIWYRSTTDPGEWLRTDGEPPPDA